MRSALPSALLCLGIAVVPATGTAQTYTSQECTAITANALAHPARGDTLAMVGYCPNAFGPTMSTLLQDAAVYADSATYDEVVRRASLRREPEIFSAALSIAQDGGATRLQRLSALAILIRYFSPSVDLDLRGMPSSYPRVDLCVLGGGTQAAPGDNPLPSDAAATTESVASTIGAGSGPDAVRVLAHCLLTAVTIDPEYLDPPDRPNTVFNAASDFQFQVLCGRRVKLVNASYAPVSLRLVWGDDAAQITANNQARDYTLPGRTATNPVGETIWQVPGTTALKFRVQRVLNGWGAPPYQLLVNIETLDTTSCS